MKFFGKGSRKFYEQHKQIIHAIIKQGELKKSDPGLPGTNKLVYRDTENKIVVKYADYNSKPESHVKKFVVPTIIHNEFTFQPFVEVCHDDDSFRERAESLIKTSIIKWYMKHNLPDCWIENIGIHEGKVKLIDW